MALIGALIIGGTGSDEKISDYLTEHYPVSGSAEEARNLSDWGVNFTYASMLVSAAVYDPVAIPVQQVGWEARNAISRNLKETFKRPRPDRSDNLSMPSGHTGKAAFAAHSAIHNLDGRHPHLATAIHGAAIMTAYMRVESGRHYPTDVLIGYALGKKMSDWTGVAVNVTSDYIGFTWEF